MKQVETTSTLEDSGRAWIVVIATFTIHLITHGIIFSFGILFLPLEENFHCSKGDIAWISSLMTGTMYLGGPVAGHFSSRYGYRPVTVAGALIGCLGYILSLAVPNLQLLYLTMGIITGLGFSFLYQPAVVSVTRAFRKNRTIACGLSSCGSGIGAFLFSPLQKWLLDTFSLHGTILINAAIILNCVPCGLLICQLNNSTGSDIENERASSGSYDKTLHKISAKDVGVNEVEAHETLLVIDTNTKIIQAPEVSTDFQEKLELIKPSTVDSYTREQDIRYTNNCQTKAETEPMPFTLRTKFVSYACGFCKMDLFSRPEFLLYVTSQFMFFLGQYIPFIYTPARLRTIGLSEITSVWVISTIGISSISGRVILGYLADRISINRTRLFSLVLLIGGTSTAFVNFYYSAPVLFLYAAVFGICLGTGVTLISVALVDLIGVESLNEAFGMSNLFTGLGTLIGPPLAGLLFDMTNSYSATFMTAGIAFFIGGVCLLMAPWFKRRHSEQEITIHN